MLLLLLLTFALPSHGGEATLTIKQSKFNIELAVTKEERKKGLMGRQSLPYNQGMLFVYDEPRIISFWMKNTLIPLDILFFDANGELLEIIPQAQPCKHFLCPTYTNKTPASFVLEIPAGSTSKHNIVPGDVFTLETP